MSGPAAAHAAAAAVAARRSTVDEERSEEREAAGGNSGTRPRGSSQGALSGVTISTTPKKPGLLSGLRNPMVSVLKASSDGDGSTSTRDGSSEGGGSPSDENEARTRLIAKIEGAKQRLLALYAERENETAEFIAMADKVEAAGGKDTPHMARIRQHYDRRNKKVAGQMDVVQKKLEAYEARLIDLDGGGTGAAETKSGGHYVLQNIRRTGANLRSMTSSVVAAPLELAQKLKRGAIGSTSSDPIEGDLGHSQFYPSALASRSASGLASNSAAPAAGSAKQKASTLPANMRMSPPDLEAAAAAAVAAAASAAAAQTAATSAAADRTAAVPSTSSSGGASSSHPAAAPAAPQQQQPQPQKKSTSSRKSGVSDRRKGEDDYKDTRPPEETLAHLPPLGTLMGERWRDEREEGRSGRNSPDTVPFVMVPRTSMTGGNTVFATEEHKELQALRGEVKQLRQHNMTIVQHMDKLQVQVQQEVQRQGDLLAAERFKYQKLEDTLNEFIDLHQAETSNLRHDLQLIASRIDYQYNDRFKKVEENLESTQNHMFRVENSLRSVLDVKEGGPWFNALLLSGATILVELLKIGLYLTAVVLDFFRPFTGTRTKAGFFLLILFFAFVLLQNAGWIVGLFMGAKGGAATDAALEMSSALINATNSAAATVAESVSAAVAAATGDAPPTEAAAAAAADVVPAP